jgi:hypothetical protein
MGNFGRQGDTYAVIGRPSNLVIKAACANEPKYIFFISMLWASSKNIKSLTISNYLPEHAQQAVLLQY